MNIFNLLTSSSGESTGGGNGGGHCAGKIDFLDIFPAGNGIGLPIAAARRQNGAVAAKGKGMLPPRDKLRDILPRRDLIFPVGTVPGGG